MSGGGRRGRGGVVWDWRINEGGGVRMEARKARGRDGERDAGQRGWVDGEGVGRDGWEADRGDRGPGGGTRETSVLGRGRGRSVAEQDDRVER